MRGLLDLPQVLAQPRDSRARIEDDLRAIEAEAPRALAAGVPPASRPMLPMAMPFSVVRRESGISGSITLDVSPLPFRSSVNSRQSKELRVQGYQEWNALLAPLTSYSMNGLHIDLGPSARPRRPVVQIPQLRGTDSADHGGGRASGGRIDPFQKPLPLDAVAVFARY